MDNNNNNNYSWRLRPPPPHTVCPTCSNPHFPFCPPIYNQYQFQPHQHFHPPPPPHDPYPPPPPPPVLFDNNNKRIRFNDDDDQRRLRLIRDHGAPVSSSVPNNLESNTYRFVPNNETSYLGVKRKFEEPRIVYQHNNVEFRGLVGSKELDYNAANRLGGNSFPRHVAEPTVPFFKADVSVGSRGVFNGQPPLPNSPPPPPPPMEMPGFQFGGQVGSSAPYSVVSQVNNPYTKSSSYTEEIQAVKASTNSSLGGTEGYRMRPPSHPPVDKPKVIDASLILKHPHRASRPDHVVVILRGLPGSGKSYLAKFLRDLEVENGGKAPRIHSMDDYFMTEVEKVEENEGSGSARGKKSIAKKIMEYCYEPEMEEAYRSSMLKAFKKTLDEGVFSFVIVDDRNLRVADFAQFWATAKRSGYEVYVLEATYKDPAGCAARNVHGFTLTDIQKMANQWEETPSLYMKLDIKSVLHGDDLEDNGIEEVDMDMEDDQIGVVSSSEDANFDKVTRSSRGDDGVSNGENKWDAVEEHPVEAVKELGKSKWSTDLDEDSIQKTELITGKSSGLSGLIKPYGKKGKPVRWADQVGKIGFSIGAGKATNVSLVIGPGSGYNLRSNPLPDEEKLAQRNGEPRRGNIFQEQLRAERESFKAVFDKRKHRISGLHLDDE